MTRGRALAAPWRPRAPHNRALSCLLRFTGGALLVVAGSALAADSASAQTPGQSRFAAPVQGTTSTPRHSRAVTIAASSLDNVTVPPGSWVPLSVSIANKGATDVDGQIVLTSNDAAATNAAGGCFANGPSTFTCLSSDNFSSGLSSAAPSSKAVGRALPPGSATTSKVAKAQASWPNGVTYEIPLELAAGTAKQLVVDVLAEPAGREVRALVEGPAGRVLAKATAQLPLAYGTAQAAVLVVTDNQAAVSALDNLVSPAGSQPQLQYVSPADLPASPVPLGIFRAVAIDRADTSRLSPAQGQSLQSYVEAGGTLVVAGGLNWRGTTAGLPAGLLPGHPTGGVTSLALPSLSRLLGTTPLPANVDVTNVQKDPEGEVTLSQGTTPIALQVSRGSGHVVFVAVDPATPPFSSWPGTPALLSRLFAPAYEAGYFASPLPYAEAGGVYPVTLGGLPPSVVAKLGADTATGPALMSPAPAEDALAGYLEQAPIVRAPPSAGLVGLLLLGYVVVVGPVCFFVLTRLRLRELAWVAVPCLAVAVTVAAVAASPRGRPAVQEVQVAQVVPDDHIAQVTTLAVVPAAGGATRRFELPGTPTAGPALVGDVAVGPLVSDLAPGVDAGLRVGPGKAPLAVSATVKTRRGAFGGWAATEQVRVAGAIRADVAAYGNVVGGRVTNDLGVKLTDAVLAVASGEAAQVLGTVQPGSSAAFTLALSPNSSPSAQAFGAPFQLLADQLLSARPPTPPWRRATGAGVSLASSSPASSGALRASDLLQALGDLASATSAQQRGAPVLVALASGSLLPLGGATTTTPLVRYQIVVVPLALALDGRPAGPLRRPRRARRFQRCHGRERLRADNRFFDARDRWGFRLPVPSSRCAVEPSRAQPGIRVRFDHGPFLDQRERLQPLDQQVGRTLREGVVRRAGSQDPAPGALPGPWGRSRCPDRGSPQWCGGLRGLPHAFG